MVGVEEFASRTRWFVIGEERPGSPSRSRYQGGPVPMLLPAYATLLGGPRPPGGFCPPISGCEIALWSTSDHIIMLWGSSGAWTSPAAT